MTEEAYSMYLKACTAANVLSMDSFALAFCAHNEALQAEREIMLADRAGELGKCMEEFNEARGKAVELKHAGKLNIPSEKDILERVYASSKPDIIPNFKTLDEFEEQEASWLIPGWIPEGQITLLAADGGVGKTSLWVHIIAKLSAGQPCVLDNPEYTRNPLRVAFMTTEDSIRQKLKKKLRLAGANMQNIIAPDFLGDTSGALRALKFGSEEMAAVIRYFRPALCVFDPVQGFVPPLINMGSRNAMRDCTAPLITLGEECGTTSMIVSHTNKRKGAYGRDRIADSADLWDVSRSVIMAGYAESEGARYLSNEKNNYAALHETLLFSIDGDGQIIKEGTTWKRDRDFMQAAADISGRTKREDCKEWILHELDEAGGSVPSKDLTDKARAEGYSADVLRRAKDELKHKREIHYYQTGSAKAKTWHIGLTSCNEFEELPPDTETPF